MVDTGLRLQIELIADFQAGIAARSDMMIFTLVYSPRLDCEMGYNRLARFQ